MNYGIAYLQDRLARLGREDEVVAFRVICSDNPAGQMVTEAMRADGKVVAVTSEAFAAVLLTRSGEFLTPSDVLYAMSWGARR